MQTADAIEVIRVFGPPVFRTRRLLTPLAVVIRHRLLRGALRVIVRTDVADVDCH